jgi:putative endonuclease
VTSDLDDRIRKHKEKKYPNSFTAKYNVDKLVYFETFETIGEAIKREKQIKAGSRKKKVELINGLNAGWEDLSDVVDDD